MKSSGYGGVKSGVSCYGKESGWPDVQWPLMAVMGFAGVLRGKKVRTTVAAGGRVNRQFVAVRPDQLWGGFYLRQHMAGLRLCGVYH